VRALVTSGAARAAATRAATRVRTLTASRARALTATRRSRLRLAAAVLAVVVVAGYGASFQSVRQRLDDRRDQLAAATTSLAATRAETAQVRSRHGSVQASTGRTEAATSAAVSERVVIDGAVRATWADIAGVEQRITEVNTARFVVGTHSGTVQACLDGVARAVGASRTGDGGGAAGALRGAAGDCSETLAYTSGARFPYDFPDPFVLRADDAYYAYSTNSGAGDIQVLRSTDLVDWELVGNALGALPRWASDNATWAPAVVARDGRYVAYYTVREAGSRRQCLSRAVASDPAGPFRDDSTGPLVCDLGGSIDPSPFVDADGRAYLLWKSEQFFATPPALWSQELTADGLGLAGSPHRLLTVDRPFEHGVVEAPTMVHDGSGYLLLYAAGDWRTRNYATAYAGCAGPAGPCLKPQDGRVLSSDQRLAGPGGAEIFRDRGGDLWVAFHAFAEPHVGYPSNRYLHVARLHHSPGGVFVDTAA
jgi:glycosyl hydrolase family 43